MLRNLTLAVVCAVLCHSSFSQSSGVIQNSSGNVESHIYQCYSQLTGESYDFCWIYPDGTFKKSNVFSFVPDASDHKKDYILGVSPVTKPYATCYSVDKYGDDGDMAVTTSGGAASLPSGVYDVMRTFSPSTDLTDSTGIRIQTGHSGRRVAVGDTVLIVISIGNISLSGPFFLDVGYSNSLSFIAPVAQNAIPRNRSEYSSFLSAPTDQIVSGSITTLKYELGNLMLDNSQKNMYLMFRVTGNTGSSANVVAALRRLTKTNSPMFPPVSQYLEFGSSFDPNEIEVRKEVCDACGNGDWFEYVVHFQNIGTASESKIAVNLKLDPKLDPTSIEILRASVGELANCYYEVEGRPGNGIMPTLPPVTTGTPPGLNLRRLHWWNPAQGSPAVAIECPGEPGNIFFYFGQTYLAGLNEPSSPPEDATTGYIKFRIKSKANYDSLSCSAGIVFGCNDEIMTHDAKFKCTGRGMSGTAIGSGEASWHIPLIIILIILVIILVVLYLRLRNSN